MLIMVVVRGGGGGIHYKNDKGACSTCEGLKNSFGIS